MDDAIPSKVMSGEQREREREREGERKREREREIEEERGRERGRERTEKEKIDVRKGAEKLSQGRRICGKM
jgi:hypothetical protein